MDVSLLSVVPSIYNPFEGNKMEEIWNGVFWWYLMYCAIRKVHEVYKNLPFITLEVQALMVTNRFPRYGSIPPAWILGERSILFRMSSLIFPVWIENNWNQQHSCFCSTYSTCFVPIKASFSSVCIGAEAEPNSEKNMETICSIGAKSQRNDWKEESPSGGFRGSFEIPIFPGSPIPKKTVKAVLMAACLPLCHASICGLGRKHPPGAQPPP